MKEIPLTRGMVALVDDEDYETLSQHKWAANRNPDRERGSFYAVTNVRTEAGKFSVRMHRMVTGADEGINVDHRDGNGLNNQRYNLRLATDYQNKHNRGKAHNNTSGFKGVSRSRTGQRWCAEIRAYGIKYRLGWFATPDEAARAYDAAARRLHGEFAYTNFQEAA